MNSMMDYRLENTDRCLYWSMNEKEWTSTGRTENWDITNDADGWKTIV